MNESSRRHSRKESRDGGSLNKDLVVLDSQVSKVTSKGHAMVLRPQPNKVTGSFHSTNEVELSSQQIGRPKKDPILLKCAK